MNGQLPILKSRDLIGILRKLGFYEVRQKGAHLCLKHPDGRFTLVPRHSREEKINSKFKSQNAKFKFKIQK